MLTYLHRLISSHGVMSLLCNTTRSFHSLIFTDLSIRHICHSVWSLHCTILFKICPCASPVWWVLGWFFVPPNLCIITRHCFCRFNAETLNQIKALPNPSVIIHKRSSLAHSYFNSQFQTYGSSTKGTNKKTSLMQLNSFLLWVQQVNFKKEGTLVSFCTYNVPMVYCVNVVHLHHF